jgi:hypothetical protein
MSRPTSAPFLVVSSQSSPSVVGSDAENPTHLLISHKKVESLRFLAPPIHEFIGLSRTMVGAFPRMRGLGSHGNQVWPHVRGMSPPLPAPALGCTHHNQLHCHITNTIIPHFALSGGVVFCLDLHPFFCFLPCLFPPLPGVFSFIYLFIYSITDIFLSLSCSLDGCFFLYLFIYLFYYRYFPKWDRLLSVGFSSLLAANVNFNQ